jgi:hypothetical protein
LRNSTGSSAAKAPFAIAKSSPDSSDGIELFPTSFLNSEKWSRSLRAASLPCIGLTIRGRVCESLSSELLRRHQRPFIFRYLESSKNERNLCVCAW